MLLSSDRYKPQVEQALSNRFNHRITLQSLKIKILPPALEMEGLSAFQTGSPEEAFQAASVRARLAVPMLLKARIVPNEIVVNKGLLWVRRRANGSWSDIPFGKTSATASTMKDWPVERILIKDATINVVDPFGPGGQSFQARMLNGEVLPMKQSAALRGEWMGAATPLQLQLVLESGVHTLTLTEANSPLTVRWTAGAAATSLTVESPVWRADNLWTFIRFIGRFSAAMPPAADPVLLRQLRCEFSPAGSSTTVKLSGKLDQGDLEAQGSFAMHASLMRIQGALALKEVPAQVLPDVHGFGGTLTGALSGLANFELIVSTQIHRDVYGTGTAEIHRGQYRFPAETIAAVKKAKTLAYFRKKYPDFENQGFAFNKLRIGAQASGQQLKLQEAWVEAGDVRVRLAGTFDTARSGMDLWSRLDLREKNAALRKLIPGRYISGAAGKDAIQPIFGRIQGKPAEWYIKSVPAAKVPAATKKQLTGR